MVDGHSFQTKPSWAETSPGKAREQIKYCAASGLSCLLQVNVDY